MAKFHSPCKCIDPPLGILCRCKEYREIADKFVTHTFGTLERKSCANFNAKAWPDPVKVRWLKKIAEMEANRAKPVKSDDSDDSDSDQSEE